MGDVAKVPFKCELQTPPGIIEIKLSGYLDAESAQEYLSDLELAVRRHKRAPDGRVGLLYFDGLSGFQTVRVARIHGEWFNNMRPHLTRVAIVTQRTAVTLALSVAKLLSKTPLQQFSDGVPARDWLH